MEHKRSRYFPWTLEQCHYYWEKLNEHFKIIHGGVFFTNGFVRYSAKKNESGKWIATSQRDKPGAFQNTIKSLFIDGAVLGEELAKMMMEYIRIEKPLNVAPVLLKRAYLFSNGVKRKSGWEGRMFFNGENYIEELAFPKLKTSKPENLQEISDILKGVFETDARTDLFKRYLGQFAFENRTEARPVLICWDNDVEGTGKTLLFDMFLKPIFPTYVGLYNDNGDDNNNGPPLAKLVFAEEAEKGYLQSKQRMAKTMSGENEARINIKFVPQFNAEVTNYTYYAANKIPLSISSEPTSPLENRWLVYKFVNKLSQNEIGGPVIKKYRNENDNSDKVFSLEKMFNDNYGDWLEKVLLPFHLKQKVCGRYGFSIPKTIDMYPLLDVGIGTEISPVFNNLDSLLRIDINHENITDHIDPNMGLLVKKFQETGWFSAKLMTIKGIDNIPGKSFAKAISIMDLKKDNARVFRLQGINQPYSGMRIDLEKFKQFFQETNEEKEKRLEDDDFQIFSEALEI